MARETTVSSEYSASRTFVGRARELAELRGGLEDVLGGRGRLFFIVGEPGIGKTRLAEELAAGAGAALALWGRCWESGGAPVYWPWVQVLRSLLRTYDAHELADRAGAGAPHLAHLLPELRRPGGSLVEAPGASTLASEHARFPLFDATTALLKSIATVRPLLVILDDLHAADLPSVLLLQFLSREIREASILVIGTYREVEMQRQAEAARIVSEVARRGHRLPLGGLSPADVARFMQTTFALSPSARLASALHQTTEGNPFFVDEVVRLLVAENPVQPPDDVPAGGLRIPHGIRDAIRERLRPLSAPCRRVVTTAAVMGREFTLAAVQAANELSVDALLDVLQEAEAGGIVARLPGALPRYSFKHALIRDTLYDDLPGGQRMLLHQQIGAWLERQYAADPLPHLAELAHHFLQAAPSGNAEKAITYAVQAAKRAAALLAYEEAARRYAAAIDALALLPGSNDSRHLELLLALGETQSRAWHTDDARATFRQAAAAARRLLRDGHAPGAAFLARAAIALGRSGLGVPRGGVVDRELAALLEEALQVLGEQDSVLRAQILARLAVELYFSDSAERRGTLSSQAVEMARRVGDAATLAYVANARHFALWDSPDAVERLGVAMEAVDFAERAGDHEMALQAHCWWLLDAVELGDTAAWDRELEVLAQLAERLRQPRSLSLVATLRGMRALWWGRFDDVETCAQQALAIGNRVQDGASVVNAGVQMYAVNRARGRYAALEPIVKGWVERLPASAVTRCILAVVFADLKREADARREFELLAAQDFVDLQQVNGLTALLPWLAELCALLGDRRRAALLYERLLPLGALNILGGPRICFGPATHALGLLAATMGQVDTAAEHFEDALVRSARMRGTPALATTQYEYARLLFTRWRHGDREAALALAAAAAAGAGAIGMDALVEKARALERGVLSSEDAPNPAPQQEGRRAVAAGGSALDASTGNEEKPVTTDASVEARELTTGGRVLRFPTRRERNAGAPVNPHGEADRESEGRGPQDAALRARIPSNEGLLRREGEYWTVGDGSAVLRLRDTKGLHYIAHLLQHPGCEFHVTDMLAPGQAQPTQPFAQVSETHLRQLDLRTASSENEPLLDAPAKAAYKHRIEDLRDQLEEATRFNDIERAAQARREIDFLSQELARAVGLRGRDRTAASHAERARLNVTRAIKAVVKRIGASNPSLGRYLATTIKTGTFCSYTPDPRLPMTWKL